MAQTIVKQNERIGAFLQAITAEVDDLPGLEADWAHLSHEQRVLVWLDWDHLMADYLTELDEQYNQATMTEAQAADYRRLLRRIKESLPIFERLDLRRPLVRLPQ